MKQFNWLTKEDDDADTTVHSWATQCFNGESDDTVLWFPYTSTTVRLKKRNYYKILPKYFGGKKIWDTSTQWLFFFRNFHLCNNIFNNLPRMCLIWNLPDSFPL